MPHINDVLKNKYGVNLQGKPLFRIVVAGRQTEKRFGTYNEFYGEIFIRQFSGLQETKKYAYLDDNVQILERWLPASLVYTEDIPETKEGSYEPIFAFQDADGKPLGVVEEVVHQIIWRLFHPELPGHRKSQQETEDAQALAAEIAHTELVLEDQGRSWIGHRLHSKEAIIKPC